MRVSLKIETVEDERMGVRLGTWGDKSDQEKRDLGSSEAWDVPSILRKAGVFPRTTGELMAPIWTGPEGSTPLSHVAWK